MSQPLSFQTDDGFETVITERPDGMLQIIVIGYGRSWRAERQTIQEAIGVATRIRTEQFLQEHPDC